jgi:hypothetical protein
MIETVVVPKRVVAGIIGRVNVNQFYFSGEAFFERVKG